MKFLTFVLLLLAVGLGLLILNHDGGSTFGMPNDDFASLIYLIPIAALLSVGVLAGNRVGFSKALGQAAIWLFIILALVTAYTYRNDVAPITSRLFSGLMPGNAVVTTSASGESEVLITKNISGHFAVNTIINGQTIAMLVDTGASSVVLTQDDARRAGIDLAALNFSVPISTANGMTTAAATRIPELTIGHISRRNVPALVSQEGLLSKSLLGMSYLSTLGTFQMRQDELRLRD